MKNILICLVLILIAISISAQNNKLMPLDYDPNEEKYIGVNTTYDFNDASVKKILVTVTNKSKKDIRVFNSALDGAFVIYFLDSTEQEVQQHRCYPLGHEPEMNQKIILKPGKSETFEYRVYVCKNDVVKKIKIEYFLRYRFMDDDSDLTKIKSLKKQTKPVSLY